MTPEEQAAREVVLAWANEDTYVGGEPTLREQERLTRRIAAAIEQARREEREALRKDILSAIPICSTDATDFQMAKTEAAAWRLLAREAYSILIDFRSQVLRYTVPPDARFIEALNRIDALIRDHDAAIRARAQESDRG